MLFVGINPGCRSAVTGHHFAGFSNRFWKLLFESGLVPERIGYEDDRRLPQWGYGITNIVARATPGIDNWSVRSSSPAGPTLIRKIRRYRPRIVAMVGVTVFRAMFPDHRGVVTLGPQDQPLAGASVFVLPNPSGRNANYTFAEMLAAYKQLRRCMQDLMR